MQMLMNQQAELEMAKLRVMIYSNWATVGGESGTKMAEEASNAFKDVLRLLFPYQKRLDDKKRDQAELAMLDRISKAMGTHPKAPSPQPAAKESLWEKMLKGVGIKKEK